jgi:hypothetical protein
MMGTFYRFNDLVWSSALQERGKLAGKKAGIFIAIWYSLLVASMFLIMRQPSQSFPLPAHKLAGNQITVPE